MKKKNEKKRKKRSRKKHWMNELKT
jgi:hypothetical protein